MANKKENSSLDSELKIIDVTRKNDTLNNLAKKEKALLVMLHELNDEDMEKVNKFIGSMNSDPIFVAADQATCD